MVILFLVFWGAFILFSTVTTPTYISTNSIGRFHFFHTFSSICSLVAHCSFYLMPCILEFLLQQCCASTSSFELINWTTLWDSNKQHKLSVTLNNKSSFLFVCVCYALMGLGWKSFVNSLFIQDNTGKSTIEYTVVRLLGRPDMRMQLLSPFLLGGTFLHLLTSGSALDIENVLTNGL